MPNPAQLTFFLPFCLLAVLLAAGCNTLQPVSSRTSEQATASRTQPAATKEAETDEQAAPEKPDAAAAETNNIYFALRSTAIDEAEKQKLREHAEQLKQRPKEKVTLVGHMDDLGSRNYNLAITEERLMAVSSQLRAFGVSSRQIRRSRAASENSAAPCRTEACRALMRKVELKYAE